MDTDNNEKKYLAAQSGRFAELRKALGLSVPEISTLLGEEEPYIYNIVGKKRGIPRNIIIRLVQLDLPEGKINANWLLTGDGGIFLPKEEQNNSLDFSVGSAELAFRGVLNTLDGLVREVSALRAEVEELKKKR